MKVNFSLKILANLFFLIINIYFWNVVSTTMRIHSSFKYSREDFVKIKITIPTTSLRHRVKRAGVHKTSSDDNMFSVPVGSNLLPYKFNISFWLAGIYHNFELTKNRKLDNAPIPIKTTFSDDTSIGHGLSSIKHVGSYYQDENGTANFHLECTSNTSSTCTLYRLFGTFEHDADHHLIEPTIQPVDLGPPGACDVHRVVEPVPTKGFMFDHLPDINDTEPEPEGMPGKGSGIKGPGMKGFKQRRPRKRGPSSQKKQRNPKLKQKLQKKVRKAQRKMKHRHQRKHKPRSKAKTPKKHRAHKRRKHPTKVKKPDKKGPAANTPLIPAAIIKETPKPKVQTTNQPTIAITDAPFPPKTDAIHEPRIVTTKAPQRLETTKQHIQHFKDVMSTTAMPTQPEKQHIQHFKDVMSTAAMPTQPKKQHIQHFKDLMSTTAMPTQPMRTTSMNDHHLNGDLDSTNPNIPGFFDIPNFMKPVKTSGKSSKSTSQSFGHEDQVTQSTDDKSDKNFFYPKLKMKGIKHYGSFDNVPVSSGGPKKEKQSDSFNEQNFKVHHFDGGRESFDKYLANVIGPHHRRKKRATGRYLVEVYTVIDFDIYNFWLREENNDPERAMQRIRQYYVFLMNGVDGRYKQLGASYKIEITLVGIYIAKTKEDLSYLEDNTSCGGGRACILDANRAVKDARSWFQRKGLPQHDHVMTFTRHDMRTGSFDTAGTAYLNSICTTRSHSIVEENFDFIAATVAAHEIGHALGAVHDGVNNPCSATPRYIMVSISSAMKKPYRKSPWQFSDCTKREIGLYLDKLNSNKTTHCMRRTYSSPERFPSVRQKKIGQTFNVDEQCGFIAGKGSFACRSLIGNGDYESVCTGLWCKDMSRSDANCLLALPAEGTTCGRGKLCHGYSCQSDSAAPTDRPNDCLYGDSPGRVLKGQTCKTLLGREKFQCYSETIRMNCCDTCQKIKLDIPGCEYGDKSTDCAEAVRRNQCYRYRAQCCQSCR